MQTTWGSREGADGDDAYRMVRVTEKQQANVQPATAATPLDVLHVEASDEDSIGTAAHGCLERVN